MVGVIVEEMPRALEFYRRLGVDVPDGSHDREHVEVKMSGPRPELRFALVDDPDGNTILLSAFKGAR
jgi:hypothetical protein